MKLLPVRSRLLASHNQPHQQCPEARSRLPASARAPEGPGLDGGEDTGTLAHPEQARPLSVVTLSLRRRRSHQPPRSRAQRAHYPGCEAPRSRARAAGAFTQPGAKRPSTITVSLAAGAFIQPGAKRPPTITVSLAEGGVHDHG